MKNSFLLLSVFFTVFTYSQTAIEQYNSIYHRYEMFDSRGNMVSYRLYNSNLQRWETYSVKNNSQGFEVVQPTSSINQPLMERSLRTRQDKYDNNLNRIKEQIKNATYFIMGTAKFKGYTYEDGIRAVNDFNANYVNKVQNGNYDLSSNATTDNLISFLAEGSIKITCAYFKECE